MLDSSSVISPAHRRLLTTIKILLVVIVIALVRAEDNRLAWPLVTWPMFAKDGTHLPGRTSSGVALQAIDSDGQNYTVWPYQLYTFIDPSVAGAEVVALFGMTDPAQQRIGFADLAARVGAALPGVDIVAIRCSRFKWSVQPYQSPPFDAAHPKNETALGSFQVADVVGAR